MIGGTGNISSAVSELLIRQGHDLYHRIIAAHDYGMSLAGRMDNIG